MANVTPNNIRGFLVPFKLTADHFWSDESSLTQNGSLAGIPVALDSTTSLVLTSNGVQSRDIEIKTHRAGHVQDNAGFVWRYDGDVNYYGHETPNKVMDVRTIQTGALLQRYTPRHAIRLESGVILVTVEHVNTSLNRTRVYKIDVDGTVSNTIVDSVFKSTLVGNDRFPTVVQLPNGAVNLAMWTVDPVDEVANIVIYQSTDDGDSWTLVSSKAIENDFDVSGSFGINASGRELQNIVLAASANQVLMLCGYNIHNTDPALGSRMAQFGSANHGLTFKYIDTSNEGDQSQFYLPKVVEYNGVFIIGYIGRVDEIRFTRISNVFDNIFDTLDLIGADILDGTVATATLNRLTDGDWTMTLDTDGRIYIYAAKTDKTIIHGGFSDLMGKSVDEYGESWSLYGAPSSGSFSDTQVANFQSPIISNSGGYKNIMGVAGQGEILLFGNWENNGTNSQADGVHILTMGGWSTQQYGKLKPYPTDYQWGYDTHQWCPFDLPNQGSIWSRVKTGAATESLGGDHVTLNASGSDLIYYLQGIYDKTNGATLHTRVSNVSGGSVTRGAAIGIQIQQPTSTSTYWLEVIIGANRIHVYDVHAGYTTPIGSASGLILEGGLQILCHVDNSTGDVKVYFGDGGSPRQYQTITGRLTLDSNSTQQIYWGIKSSSGTARAVDFHFFSYGVGDDVGVWSDRVINSKKYSSQGFETQIKDGLTISTLDGPAREGDEYTLSPQYGSPIQRTLHIVSPSPKVGWRSDAVANPDTTNVPTQTISWLMDLNMMGGDRTHTESQAIGIHLTNVNFKEFAIEYHNGASWIKYATVQNTVGGDVTGGFEFDRDGMSIHSLELTGPYLHLNECEGWSVLLVPEDGEPVQRRIQSNGDGVLGQTSSKRAYITMKDAKPTDPTDGTAYLIPSSVTTILNVNELSGFRIKITSQKTYEGYFEIGTMVAGPLVIAGPQYGRGRTIQIESNVVENTAANGTIYTTSRGDDGRVVRIAWTDGVDTSALNAPTAAPNHYDLYSGEPIAAMGSAPTAMMGLIQYVKSSQNAIVYLPNIATGPSAHIVLNRYHNQILTTIGTEIQIDHVVGDEMLDENRGEVFRVSTVLLREVR